MNYDQRRYLTSQDPILIRNVQIRDRRGHQVETAFWPLLEIDRVIPDMAVSDLFPDLSTAVTPAAFMETLRMYRRWAGKPSYGPWSANAGALLRRRPYIRRCKVLDCQG